MKPVSLFSKAVTRNYAFYQITLFAETLVGGTPRNPRQMLVWIQTNLQNKNSVPNVYLKTLSEMYPEEMRTIMTLEGEEQAKAITALAEKLNELQGTCFKRDEQNRPYIEGRQIKAGLKEAANLLGGFWKVDSGTGKSKTPRSVIAERVFVEDERVYLEGDFEMVEDTRIVHVEDFRIPDKTRSSFKPYEMARNVRLTFTLAVDTLIAKTLEKHWEDMWVRFEFNGLGADRSIGRGRFVVEGITPLESGQSNRVAKLLDAATEAASD